ncbi:MAG: membrane protein insertase YidC [Phycisphaerae bacterium]|nr:membrane protein insertase YidC [Phycisphaerae bacterium]
MPAEVKHPVLRIVVPLLLVAAGIGIFWAVATNTTRARSIGGSPGQPAPSTTATTKTLDPSVATPNAALQPPGPNPTPDSSATPGAPETPTTAPAHAGSEPAPRNPSESPAATAIPGPRFRAKVWPAPDRPFDPLGSLNPKSGYELLVTFTDLGAGVDAVDLTNHFRTLARTEHERVQASASHQIPGGPLTRVAPLAALALTIDKEPVNLAVDPAGPLWRQTGPGEFEAIVERIADAAPVARVVRRYTLQPGSFDLELHQHVVNLTASPLAAAWHQFGPIDLPSGTLRYGGDIRRVRFGYLLNAQSDPSRQFVEASRFMLPRTNILGVSAGKQGVQWPDLPPLWPTKETTADGLSPVFTALTSRYFTVAAHPLLDAPAANSDKVLRALGSVDRVVMGHGLKPDGNEADPTVVLRMHAPETSLPAGATLDLSMGVYAGPLTKPVLEKEPIGKALGLGDLVIYTFGGPCAFCTFQPVARALRWYLGFLHDHVVFDWALAIMVLVVTVRTILHPVTRWSQVNMARFSKQIQAVAPKQKKIQERFKDDPAKMREEIARLMREEKINYSGALGCLPLFLQTPIWIALYAMIYFTFELRHEAAFFGVFQAVSGGKWTFLADLSEPDHFIPFASSMNIPVLSWVMGPIDGFNIVPIILGFVFYLQQKYLTPPTAPGTLSPEQESQQRMIKIMTVVMFPLFMYNAPAALAIYFMTNSTLGILEASYIRRHIKAEELLLEQRRAVAAATPGPAGPSPRAASKPGFFERIRLQVEERQRELERQRKRKPRP